MKEDNKIKLAMIAQKLCGHDFNNYNGEMGVILKESYIKKTAQDLLNIVNEESGNKTEEALLFLAKCIDALERPHDYSKNFLLREDYIKELLNK